MIFFDEEKRIFHLRNDYISYIMGVEEQSLLAHIYYGKSISGYNGGRQYPRLERSFSFNFEGDKKRIYSRDTLLQEISTFGGGDFRIPTLEISGLDGSHQSDFRYESYKIYPGKSKLRDLPATFVEDEKQAETLEICLKDVSREVSLYMYYSIFKDLPVITRSHRLANDGKENIVIHKLSSLSLDFQSDEWEAIHLPGSWGNERNIQRNQLTRGIHTFDSKRGTSSHQENPFVSLVKSDTTEDFGDAYGFALVYSGNHEESIEVDQYQQLRLTIGINSYGFEWNLESGQSFIAPEVVCVYSDKGLNGMSQTFHKVIHNHLTNGRWKKQERPILINNWEATYFDFDTKIIKELIDESKELGIELFVLDDGWFGKRNSDQTSLGDWYVNKEKIHEGIKDLATHARNQGMDFGLWFEPEMISRDSDLFKEHPDWYLHNPQYPAATSRSQFVLNLSLDCVRDYIIEVLSNILSAGDVSYVKWDMNRYLSDVFSFNEYVHHGEVSHRYVLNLYSIYDYLISSFPDILFEGCSGGGGRFDLGILYYMPQIWTSDNSDGIARLKIQYGTSLVYPISSMGSHVSAVPNHQNGRVTSLETRGNVAMSGILGYELDPRKLSQIDKEKIRCQIAYYKENRRLFQYGKFIRLRSPFDTNDAAWEFLEEDKSKAIVIYTNVLSHAAAKLTILKVKGLTATSLYYCKELNQMFFGDELEHSGFYIEPIFNQKDFDSRIFTFTKING